MIGSKQEVDNEIVGISNPREFRGSYTYPDGAVYTGEWYEFYRDGKGIMEWSNGAKYQGQWKRNKKSGKGKFNHHAGDVYEGIF